MKYIILLALIIGIASMTNEEEAYVYNYLVEHGLTEAGAAGLMGNLKAESGMNSVIYENSKKKRIGLSDQDYVNKVNNGQYSEYNFVHDGAGFGIAQWTYHTRKQELLDSCRGRIGDINCQLDFLMTELKRQQGVYKTLTTSNDVRTCAVKVLKDFERPKNQGITVQNTRTDYSQTYYNSHAGKKPQTPTTHPSTHPHHTTVPQPPHTHVPHTHVPHTHVPHTHVPHTHVPQTHVPHTHVPHTHVPQTHVPHTHVPHTHVPQTHVPHTHVPQPPHTTAPQPHHTTPSQPPHTTAPQPHHTTPSQSPIPKFNNKIHIKNILFKHF